MDRRRLADTSRFIIATQKQAVVKAGWQYLGLCLNQIHEIRNMDRGECGDNVSSLVLVLIFSSKPLMNI